MSVWPTRQNVFQIPCNCRATASADLRLTDSWVKEGCTIRTFKNQHEHKFFFIYIYIYFRLNNAQEGNQWLYFVFTHTHRHTLTHSHIYSHGSNLNPELWTLLLHPLLFSANANSCRSDSVTDKRGYETETSFGQQEQYHASPCQSVPWGTLCYITVNSDWTFLLHPFRCKWNPLL